MEGIDIAEKLEGVGLGGGGGGGLGVCVGGGQRTLSYTGTLRGVFIFSMHTCLLDHTTTYKLFNKSKKEIVNKLAKKEIENGELKKKSRKKARKKERKKERRRRKGKRKKVTTFYF